MSASGDQPPAEGAARPRPAGLYIHVPFCRSVCPYCDFAVARGSAEDRARYVRALLLEIEGYTDRDWTFDTVYFGGGTPSSLSSDQFADILRAVQGAFRLQAPRLFLEANPEDVDPASLAAWRALGFEFLSLGIQSFDSRELQSLGRLHRREGAERCVTLAKAAGFATISIDLIYGSKRQSISAWRENLKTALALGADHLSCYQLTFHEGTPFGRALEQGKLQELSDGDQADFFAETHRQLRGSGWIPYEVSNFARSTEHRSRHNQKYWDHTPYLGLGPSAHSFRDRRRWWNERDWRAYATRLETGQSPLAGSEDLVDAQLALEVVMLGLRTMEGIDLEVFERRFGIDLVARNRRLLDREPRLVVEKGRLKCTPDGFAIADGLAAQLALG